MLKRFAYSCTRYHGDLEDDFEYEIFAEDRLDALLLIVADLNNVSAHDASEAKQKAKQWLGTQLGKAWDVDDFLSIDLQLWKDYATCYRVRDISEISRRYNDRQHFTVLPPF